MNAADGPCPSPTAAAYLHHDMMFPTPTTATTTTVTATAATTAAASMAPVPGQPPRQQQQWMMPHLPPPQLHAPCPPAPQQTQQQQAHEQQHHQQHHQQQQYPPQPFGVASAAAAGGTVPIDAATKHPRHPHNFSVDMMMTLEEDNYLHNGERPPRRKRPKSMAFAYLQGQLLGDQSGAESAAAESCPEIVRDLISEPARSILQDLLDQHHVRLQESPDDVVTALAYVAQRFLPKKTVNKSMSIDRTLHWAKMDQLSFLGSFLMVIEEAEIETASAAAQPHLQDGTAAVVETTTTAAVSALDLIKRCCLAINPSKIPPLMDAEEMAIAALEFLGSSTITDNDSNDCSNGNNSTMFPDLPLIRFVKYESDVRKRSYEKVGTWQLNDVMMQKVAALEEVFLLDCTDYRFLRRGVCGPRMTSSAAEDALYLRGKHKVTANSSTSSSMTNKKNSTSTSRAAAALRMATAMKTAANPTSGTVLVGVANANNNHPIDGAEHRAQGSLSKPIITLDDDGGEGDDGAGEATSHSHSPAYADSYE